MKASGSVSSLLQGVSQQTPSKRGPGQHTEQINMLPDPVHGLARRPGTQWEAEKADAALDPSLFASMTGDSQRFRSYNYTSQGHDYTVLYRIFDRFADSPLPVVQVYDRTTKTFLNTVRNTVDAQLDLLGSGGVSAITSIGRFVFMAGFATSSAANTTDLWGNATNLARSVAWIRGGTYNRTFKITATRTDGTQFTFQTTTPTSAYTGTLDTSGVPIYAADPAGGTSTDSEAAYITGTGTTALGWAAWQPTGMTVKQGATTLTNVTPAAPANASQYNWVAGAATIQFHASLVGANNVTMTYTHTKTVTNPNYAKYVTDITNAYNTAVTNWIASSAAAIAPAAIALALKNAAVAAGLTSATVQDSTVVFDNVKALVVSDGGDGTLIRGVAQEVTSVDQVSELHYVGKVVRVRSANSAESFYLKAVPKDPLVTSGVTQVTWVEGAAIEYDITQALVYMTVSGTTAYIASSATLLAALVSLTPPPPDYIASTVGDADSSPLPYFIGKPITYLGVFQDRLVIGAGAVLRFSKVGDYLNFFRSSVLTIPADDTIEVLSQGSEDDTLRYSIIYDRDLVIFGEKRQYVVSGKAVLTPTAPNMAVLSSWPQAAQLPPLAVGQKVFYGQVGEVGASVFQMQPGLIVDSPETFIASGQVDSYIGGRIIEMANNSKPAHLLVRTTGDAHSLVAFTFLDKAQDGQVQDAWHRLSWHQDLGPIIGMNQTTSGMLIYFLRTALDFAGVLRTYWVAETLNFTASLSTRPYFDSIRTLTQVNANSTSVHAATTGDWSVAYGTNTIYQFIGDTLANQAVLTAAYPTPSVPYVGITMPTMFTPTNPFVKDRQGNNITNGVLTVGYIQVSTAASSGFSAAVTSDERQAVDTYAYSNQTYGTPDAIVGRVTVADDVQQVPVALSNKDYTLSLSALTWLPLTITNLEWTGQWFYRTQRF